MSLNGRTYRITYTGGGNDVVTVSGSGVHPEARADGDKVAVGKQSMSPDGTFAVR